MSYLSSNQLKQYKDEGSVSPINIFSKEKAKEIRKEIELIEKRNLLRDQGNYNDADKIRSQLDELGIIVEDKDGKTSWKQKN